LKQLLKDKKIDILVPHVTTDGIGNQLTEWTKLTPTPLWAYFRQIGGDEYYAAKAQQLSEDVLFIINWRGDINTTFRVVYRGKKYDIKRLDIYEGYKDDLKLYCKLV
jgi:SPP1 family predicted phage head-tail adaptor